MQNDLTDDKYFIVNAKIYSPNVLNSRPIEIMKMFIAIIELNKIVMTKVFFTIGLFTNFTTQRVSTTSRSKIGEIWWCGIWE